MQTYEEYWKLTLAYTDFNDVKFIKALNICVDFIDNVISNNPEYANDIAECTTIAEKQKLCRKFKYYSDLQREIRKTPELKSDDTGYELDEESARKAINQMVKLGFITPFLTSYHELSKLYLQAKTNRKRETILSKIVYTSSSFQSSVTKPSDIHQLNFLIKTLVEHPQGKLRKDEISALMLVDLNTFHHDYLDKTELDEYLKKGLESGFVKRKYNQISHLWNLLSKLDDLQRVGDDLYFAEDAQRIFSNIEESTRKRDPYLHRLYKNQLQEESEEYYGDKKCMLEKLAYPVLIASHIKPFIQSDDNEAYDPNNGLLLSRTLDSLFDLKYISFDDNGNMLKSDRLSDDVWQHWQNVKLDSVLLNDKRKQYLAFHRELMKKEDSKIKV
ncbi:HNH endonuclease [Actinobacillus arthritidis]|uniref:HNH endonuclease n=1 Tax=Actinobacillus arthritidis TaxID=157339 RepID=UPI002441DE3E|nr:HNH endonuclease [Actinobacillus arthritidis]WGE89431.1 HNH endonuclease [Actinobacillus arthritidis]